MIRHRIFRVRVGLPDGHWARTRITLFVVATSEESALGCADAFMADQFLGVAPLYSHIEGEQGVETQPWSKGASRIKGRWVCYFEDDGGGFTHCPKRLIDRVVEYGGLQ